MPGKIVALVVAALVLYGVGIIGFRRKQDILYCVILMVGLGFDWYVSIKMYLAGSHDLTLHMVLGWLALAMMTALVIPAGRFVLGQYFLWEWPTKSVAMIQKYGLVAYAVWVTSFITGALMGMGVIPRF